MKSGIIMQEEVGREVILFNFSISAKVADKDGVEPRKRERGGN